MFIIIRFLIYSFPILNFVLLEFLRSYPYYLKYTIIFISIYLLFVIWYLLRNAVIKQSRSMTISDLSHYVITPLFLGISAILFLVFVNNLLVYRIIAFLVSFFIYLFLENLFIFLYYPHKYILSSLENLSAYLNLLTIFFFYSAYFGLNVFLRFESKWLFIALLLINSILFLQSFLINKLKIKKILSAFFIGNLLMAEFLWINHYLTITYLIKGFLSALLYYIISSVFRYYFLSALDKKALLKQVFVVLFSVLIVLLTAKWY